VNVAPMIASVIVVAILAGCEREARRFSAGTRPDDAGAAGIVGIAPPTKPVPAAPRDSGYEETAYAISQGKRLFTWYNCVGCHGHGGGNIGPALMDDRWRYGAEPPAVYASIAEGRPNGMPSVRGRVPESQLWQLTAYVRSMSGLVRTDAAPGRSDAIQVGEPEQRRERQTPRSDATAPAQ
jgi:cytochrome c oxidase cbb3-type subunit III